jgi:MYXO-CTERM domain-containing protein
VNRLAGAPDGLGFVVSAGLLGLLVLVVFATFRHRRRG